MLHRAKNITVIGYALSLLYGTSFLIYLGILRFTPFAPNAAILSLLYLSLFCSALAVVWIKEWGRKSLVVVNVILAIYQVVLYGLFADFIQPSYILMNIVIAIYFNQKKIKFYFRPSWKFSRKSILVVDDDEGLLKTVNRILLPNGYSVLTATTGEKGLQIAKLQKPDLIILDVILPGIKGREVCATLKNQNETKNIPVIFLTAKDSEDDVMAEKAAGAVSHLTKPVNASTLLAEVRKTLGG